MNKALVSILFLLLFIVTINLPKEANAREITNIQWNKSVARGKKLFKFRETVTSPALGKKAWKITLLPRDCGRDLEGDKNKRILGEHLSPQHRGEQRSSQLKRVVKRAIQAEFGLLQKEAFRRD